MFGFKSWNPLSTYTHEVVSRRLEDDTVRQAVVPPREFLVAWADAEEEVRACYRDWRDAADQLKAGLWFRYRAALDREQQAAQAYATAVGS